MIIKEGEGETIANSIQSFVKSLNSNRSPEANFHHNYVRKGTIYEEGEVGILLNSDAVQSLIEHALEMISGLTIRQAKSYMYVDDVVVDYNDSNKMMRIKRDESEVETRPLSEYATYFYAK